ncbi:hypothetical protein CHISP_3705 [Chitinispirillum alkaliphilum]|nr:hypothetical protein CHISP_3705 [Chitinispirillum alkaliphilum]
MKCLIFSLFALTIMISCIENPVDESSNGNTNIDRNNIPFDTNIKTTFSSNEHVKNYKFTLETSGLFRFEIEDSRSLDLIVRLFNSDSVEIASSNENLYFPIKEGMYHLTFRTRWPITSNQKTDVMFFLSIDETDTTEYNNEREYAFELELEQYVQTKTMPRTDVDWFKINIPEDMIVELKLDSIPTNLQLEINTYETEGVLLSTNTYSQLTSDIRQGHIWPKGKYYVRIKDRWGSNQSDRAYLFGIFRYMTDSLGYNNNIQSATPLPLNHTIAGNIWPKGDVDFFKLELPDTGVYHIQLDSVSNRINMRWSLFDQEGTVITPSSTNRTFTIRNPGTYFISLFDRYNNSYSEMLYNLTITK